MVMTSARQTDEAVHEETRVMEHSAQERRNLLRHHFSKSSSKERELTPRRIRNIKMREKEKALKTAKLNAMTGSDRHAPSEYLASSTPSGSYQKPWPSTDEVGVEELVKHMSKVPGYLQRMDRGDNIQEKALNFGVLDWGLLEKWTYHQKHMANGRGENSSSNSYESSSFSTSGSFTGSRGSTGGPIPRMKQSAPKDARQNPFVIGSQAQLIKNKISEHVMYFQDPITSAINFSAVHDQHHATDHGPGTECVRHKHLKDKRKYSGLNTTSHNVSLPPDARTSCSTSKYEATSASTHRSVEAEDGRSRKPEQKQYLTLLQRKECMWDHLEPNVNVRHSSFESLVSNDGKPIERHHKSFSGSSPEDIQSTYRSPHVPHSCPLSCTIWTNECASASNILQEKRVAVSNPGGQNGRHDQFTRSFYEQFQVSRVDKFGQDEVKSSTATGRKLPDCLTSGGPTLMSRSSWEGPSAQQSKSIACPDKSDGNKATENDRGRRSPLRRILDPLLKPKHHIYFSGPITASSIRNSHVLNDTGKHLMREELASSYGPRSSSDTGINFIWQSEGNLNSSNQVLNNSTGSIKDKGQLASTRQALLQLAWKNGLPLFMFSSSDSDILAATLSKKSISNKDNCRCIYTIFSVHEVKKKSGVWINPTSKTKKHGLLSNVVGQLKVSRSMPTKCDSKSHSVAREFVLLGSEMAPTSHESVSSLINNELAAIIVQDPLEKPESSKVHLTHCSQCKYSSLANSAENVCSCGHQKGLQVDQNNDNSSLSTVIAILPSGVHGLSDKGEPSPLIQRWKSGGTCDCGGWDEGCRLTILTNNQEKRCSDLVQSSCSMDGTHRLDLFVQGGSHESGHTFSMVSFKEGLYTVDFRSSIAPLQAFAICIATLHSRKLTIRSVEAQTLQEHIIAENVRKAPPSYVPNHPPLSPVGRA